MASDIAPVRCFSCGQVLARLSRQQESVDSSSSSSSSSDRKNQRARPVRLCCRRMLLSATWSAHGTMPLEEYATPHGGSVLYRNPDAARVCARGPLF